ncbi:MAG: hypothetical protein JRN68_03930 [Nitrososphaerota archaeon]|nr:hypothetical protein [Nitrososphaerota archaeon]
MKVLFFSNKEAREMNQKLREKWSRFNVPDVNPVRKVEVDDERWIVLGDFTLVMEGKTIAPFIGDEKLCAYFPGVTVDMGALRFITNGANVMRPGIKSFPNDFEAGDIVIVKDEKFGKTIAVCEASVGKKEAEILDKGVVLKNLSYVGDKFWNVYKQLAPSL